MDYNAAALEMHAKYPGKLTVNSLFEVKDRDALEARRLLKAVADAEPSALGDAKVRDVLTVEEDLAARRRDKAHDDLGERRLAAAVGAGEDDELAVRNVDGNVV